MPAGASPAFAFMRVARGQGRPSEEQCRAALSRDRERLHLPDNGVPTDIVISGPYAVTEDGAELDEYVIWER
jgi:hypothetical protein